MLVISLNHACSGVPYSYGHVLRACDHPFALTVKRDSSDIVCVSFELLDGVWVARLDIVQADHVPASRSEVFLVGGDAQAIDLGLWMLDCPRAYS